MKNIIKRMLFLLKIIYIDFFTRNKVSATAHLNFKTKLEGNNKISKRVSIDNSMIGFGTYIGENTYLVNSKVGRYCSISSNVRVILGTHPTSHFVSTHPAFYSTLKQSGFTYTNRNLFDDFKKINNNSIEIGNDVWIGSNVLIMEGVKIADGSIIGAGAIVTKDTEPYSICVGVPAKIIKYRFTDDEIKYLKELQWWNKGEKWIINHAHLFDNIKDLMNNGKK